MRTDTIYHPDYWLKKGYNEDEAKFLIEKLKKETSWRCKEFWIKRGFTEEQAIVEISKKQSEISLKRDRNKKILSPYDEKYYINKGINNKKEIKKLILELKNRTNPYNKWSKKELKEVIEKRKQTYYNKSETQREKINKSRGLNKNQLYEKFGIEKTEIILNNRGKGIRRPYEKKFSKISLELYNTLSEMNKDKIFLYGKNEKFIPIKDLNNKKGYFVDFLYVEKNKIIEFNGDFWHFNPNKYIAESFCVLNGVKVIAENVWEQDRIKLESLKNNGFDVLVVWENEYINNKDLVIKKCDEFLKK